MGFDVQLGVIRQPARMARWLLISREDSPRRVRPGPRLGDTSHLSKEIAQARPPAHPASPVPRLYVMPGEQANAFATGRDPTHAAVAVTEGLIATLEPDHVRAVMAHEFAHIRNRDILVSSIAAMVAGAISAATSILQLSFLFGGSGGSDDDSPLGTFGAIAAMILAPIGALLLQMGVSRQREYLADATAAEMLGDGRPLAEALRRIAGDDAAPLDVPAATAPMYILNPLRGEPVAKLFSTHPPVRDRIRRLLAYGNPERAGRPRAIIA